jgi:hypothetical protein
MVDNEVGRAFRKHKNMRNKHETLDGTPERKRQLEKLGRG